MPLYEYRCAECRARFTVLARSVDAPPPSCSRCGGPRVDRLLSRFASPRSDEARMDALTDPSTFGDVDERDPRSVARWMKRMSRETGEDLGEDEDIDRAVEDSTEESSAGGKGDLDG